MQTGSLVLAASLQAFTRQMSRAMKLLLPAQV